MSSSQHPIALDVERRVGGQVRLLLTVMALPLVDGIFAALVLAGALGSLTGIIEVGLLIFGGSATVAVVIAELDGGPRETAKRVLGVGVVLIAGAIVVAALAPTLRALLSMAVFERFAGLVVLTVAAKTASARVGDVLPRPAIVILLGLAASLDPAGATLVVQTDVGLMARAAAAAGVGTAFALLVALASPWLRNAVDIDRFRFGSAVALGVLPLGFYGVLPANAPVALAVLAITALLAFDPQRARHAESVYDPDPVDVTAAFADGGASQGVSHDDPSTEPHEAVDRPDAEDDDASPTIDAAERLPWL